MTIPRRQIALTLKDGTPKRVFICYARSDSRYVERLLLQLKSVQHLLQVFVDTALAPGVEWRKEIESALDEARVAVLFISPEFAASDFILQYEIPSLIASAKKKLAIIMPLIVSPVVNTGVIATLLEYQSPTDLKPLINMKKPQREQVFVRVAEAIINASTHWPTVLPAH